MTPASSLGVYGSRRRVRSVGFEGTMGAMLVRLAPVLLVVALAGCGGSGLSAPTTPGQAERIATTASLTDDDLPGEWWTDEAFADADRDVDGQPIAIDAA